MSFPFAKRDNDTVDGVSFGPDDVNVVTGPRPEFRSMLMMHSNAEPALMHAGTGPPLQHQFSNLQKNQPNKFQQVPAFGKPPPAAAFQATTKATLSSTAPPSVSDNPPTPWKQPVLTHLGLYHPLEVNHCRIAMQDHGLLHRVLDKLVSTFRLYSLHVDYEESPICANCETMDRLTFCVCVWKENTGGGSSDLIVELQRTSGDSISFAQHARDILTAAKKAATPTTTCDRVVAVNAVMAVPTVSEDSVSRAGPSPSHKTHSPFVAPMQSRACRAHHNLITSTVPPSALASQEDPSESALHIARGLLLTDRFDACQLGLQSLAFLTDPWQSGQDTAKNVASYVLTGTSSSHQDSFVSDMVLTLALKQQWPAPSPNSTTNTVTGLFGPAPPAHSYLALQVLAHALSVMSSNGNMEPPPQWIAQCLDRCRCCLGHEDLIGRLLELVSGADSQPHVAFYAMHALHALVCASPPLGARIPPPLIQKALHIGCSQHAALETASEQLLGVLQLQHVY